MDSLASAFWNARTVLVTGGASFIGSHLVDRLVELGADVTVVDDLSSGSLGNIQKHIHEQSIRFRQADLGDVTQAFQSCAHMDTVFHLAAAHGGRGYVDLRQVECAGNFRLDNAVFEACARAGVRKIVFASSGCVYPLHLQRDPGQALYLDESDVGPPYEADGLYGWAKLMGELSLQAMHREQGTAAVSCRYFTVYGPRSKENHAVCAMMARAVLRQDPFRIWGDGRQIRNWTHVSDIVRGTLLAGELIDDASAINLGTSERVTVMEAAQMMCQLVGYRPQFELQRDMPVGPMNRVARWDQARSRLGWEPRVRFADGIRGMYDWYVASRSRPRAQEELEPLLVARSDAVPEMAG